MEELLTVPEAAAESRMSESWWRQRVHRREIPVVRIGRRVFVSRETIARVQRRSDARPGSHYVNKEDSNGRG